MASATSACCRLGRCGSRRRALAEVDWVVSSGLPAGLDAGPDPDSEFLLTVIPVRFVPVVRWRLPTARKPGCPATGVLRPAMQQRQRGGRHRQSGAVRPDAEGPRPEVPMLTAYPDHHRLRRAEEVDLRQRLARGDAPRKTPPSSGCWRSCRRQSLLPGNRRVHREQHGRWHVRKLQAEQPYLRCPRSQALE